LHVVSVCILDINNQIKESSIPSNLVKLTIIHSNSEFIILFIYFIESGNSRP